VFTDPIKGFGLISGYALRRAALATGLHREGTSFTKLHEALGKEQAQFQELTRDLAPQPTASCASTGARSSTSSSRRDAWLTS